MTPKLNKLLVEINSLKARVVAAQGEFLVSLHSELGFESVEALIEALRASTAKAPKVVKSASTAPKAKKRGRAKITKEIRDEVVALVGKGETGSAIAAKLGISLPSVQNIKKAAGLVGKKETKAKVKAPKTKSPKAKASKAKALSKKVKPSKSAPKANKAPNPPAETTVIPAPKA